MKTFRSYCRYLSALLALLVLSMPVLAQTQDKANYPNRSMKIIVPVAPNVGYQELVRSAKITAD